MASCQMKNNQELENKLKSLHCDWHHCLIALAHKWRAIRKGGSLFFNHELNEL